MLYLRHELKQYFAANQDLFDQLMDLKGDCFRSMDGRQTHKVMVGQVAYFIKQHQGVGWLEIIKNLLQFRKPVISARNEWEALTHLKKIGIDVPEVAGYGERGCNPAKRESFVLMEAVPHTQTLEDLMMSWREYRPSFALKNQLIKQVATMTRQMHQAQINHRDLYVCHFLIRKDSEKLCLIDLHRARKWFRLPMRWRIKDLAALYFSSKDAGLTQRDYLRFIKYYRQKPIKKLSCCDKNMWQRVKQRGEKLYREHQ